MPGSTGIGHPGIEKGQRTIHRFGKTENAAVSVHVEERVVLVQEKRASALGDEAIIRRSRTFVVVHVHLRFHLQLLTALPKSLAGVMTWRLRPRRLLPQDVDELRTRMMTKMMRRPPHQSRT